MNVDETQQSEETQATQALDESQSQSQEEKKEDHLFGSLHPCNPSQNRLDLWRTKPKITIGRRQDNDVVLSGGKVSNVHAEIVWDGKSDTSSCVMIRDMNSTNGTYINGHKIPRGTYRILKQGNEISFGSQSSETDGDDYRYMFYHLAAGLPKTGLYAHYDLGPELGRGSFAIVYRALSKTNGQWYAVKIIQESRRTGRDDASNTNNVNLQREIAIMRKLKHPNICELKDVFICDNNEINLVIELVEGGDLLEHIITGRMRTEADVRHITYQLCDALAYVHDQGVAHRDLKPENVLLTNSTPPRVKVADFGLAKVSDSITMLKTMCGTPAYLAPEVITQEPDEGYDCLVDSWSVGVILFSMIAGANPFTEDDTQRDLRVRIVERRVDWQLIAKAEIRRNFIERLLTVSPRKRMTMRASLEHPWLRVYVEQLAQAPPTPGPGHADNDEPVSQGFEQLNINSNGPSTEQANGKTLQRRRDVLEQAQDNEVVIPEPSLEMISKFSAIEQRRKAKAREETGNATRVEKGPGKRVHAELSDVAEQGEMQDGDGTAPANGKASGSSSKASPEQVEEMPAAGPSNPPKRGSKGSKTPKPKSNSGDRNATEGPLRRSNRNAPKVPRIS
ncbi:kinase-like protein [Marasmius fiardii PR-910]|nr:kinase-like protein [Marasmius fiardii PR-910]